MEPRTWLRCHTIVRARVLLVAIVSRVISVTTRDELVRIHVDQDPPPLTIPTAKPTKTKVIETAGRYGALDPARSRSPMVIAMERVQAWDLNETPAFGKPAPFGALIVQPDAVQFCRERDGRLRKSFDFMARAVTVTVSAAPKGSPKRIVLANLRTPSGLTQVLCRDEFATLLAANTGRKQKR